MTEITRVISLQFVLLNEATEKITMGNKIGPSVK